MVLFFSTLLIQQSCQQAVPQGERTSVIGTVQDINAKPIPGVEVTIVNLETGVSRKIRTNTDGSFQISGLPAGKYQIMGDVSGVPLVAKDFTVTTGQTAFVAVTPVGPVPEGERNEAKRTVEVVESTFGDEMELQKWLNGQAQMGKRLRGIVPVKYQTSLFLVESSETGAVTADLVQRVHKPLSSDELSAHINLHPDKTFVGLHRLDDNSYLMVLRYGRR